MKNDNIARFVGFINSLGDRDDRAALAKLKRAAGNPFQNFEVLPVIGEYIPPGAREWEFKCYMLVASLFSLNPLNSDKIGNLGESLVIFRNTLSVGGESFENRFAAILNADDEDIAHRLVQVVRQISREDIYINYYRLLDDLLYWNLSDKPVQLRWARSFWAYQKENDDKNKSNEKS